MAVLGPDVELPTANKTYYRVVAVDEFGKRSGPSDYATAPRPVIFSKPPQVAKVGAEYRYEVRANRSLGDLTARMSSGDMISGYFDIEKPQLKLREGPAWLKLDPATGMLSGIPDAPGKFPVTIEATITRTVRILDEKTLAWGNEKVLSTDVQQVGSDSQRFTIEVQP